MKTSESPLGVRRNEMLTELASVITAALIDADMSPHAADAAANAAVDAVVEHWGGQPFSWPKDFLWRLSLKEMEIYSAHQGDIAATARKFGYTARGIRKVLDRVSRKLAEQRKKSPQLDFIEHNT